MNVPNLDFPELNLKLSYLKNDKKPTKKFGNIKLVRIKSARQGFSFIIYPEFKHSNKWYKFWKDDQPIIAKMIIHSINGVSSGANKFRLKKIKKTIEKWLKEFAKDGHKFKIVDTSKMKEKPKEIEDEDDEIEIITRKKDDSKEIVLDDEIDNVEEQEQPSDKNIV